MMPSTLTSSMKTLLTLAAATFFSFTVGTFTSNLTVPAGQTFYLGGSQDRANPVSAENVGAVAVTLSVQTAGQAATALQRLEPGKSAKLTLPPQSALLVENANNDKDANLIIKGPNRLGNLAMGYR